MSRVTSGDGTSIAYDRQGSGPAVILIGGGLVDPATGRAGRWENAPLAAELSARFTVVNYDRRGRGDSGDSRPYAVARELEDLDALIAEAGAPAHLYGISSGGALALEATAAGLAVNRLAVYEVPYCMARPVLRWSRVFLEQLGPMLAEGRRGDALALFMWFAGSSEEDIAGARRSPWWPGLEALAHTLAYDAACMGDYRPATARLATITQPVLVATGGVSPDSRVGMGGLPPDFFEQAADAIAASIPKAQRRTFEGQGHVADARVAVPLLERFFSS